MYNTFSYFSNFQAETSEDLYEWKTALEHALAQAPSAAIVMGHNGIFRNDTNDSMEGSFPHQCLYFNHHYFFNTSFSGHCLNFVSCFNHACSWVFQGRISALLSLQLLEGQFYLHQKILMEVHLSLRKLYVSWKILVSYYLNTLNNTSTKLKKCSKIANNYATRARSLMLIELKILGPKLYQFIRSLLPFYTFVHFVFLI